MLHVSGVTFALVPCAFSRTPSPPSPRRVAAAARAVARDQARTPLFPETARHATGAERLAAQHASHAHWLRAMRAHRARSLVRLRALLAPLPPAQLAALSAAWSAAPQPKAPEYLLGFLRKRGVL